MAYADVPILVLARAMVEIRDADNAGGFDDSRRLDGGAAATAGETLAGAIRQRYAVATRSMNFRTRPSAVPDRRIWRLISRRQLLLIGDPSGAIRLRGADITLMSECARRRCRVILRYQLALRRAWWAGAISCFAPPAITLMVHENPVPAGEAAKTGAALPCRRSPAMNVWR